MEDHGEAYQRRKDGKRDSHGMKKALGVHIGVVGRSGCGEKVPGGPLLGGGGLLRGCLVAWGAFPTPAER